CGGKVVRSGNASIAERISSPCSGSAVEPLARCFTRVLAPPVAAAPGNVAFAISLGPPIGIVVQVVDCGFQYFSRGDQEGTGKFTGLGLLSRFALFRSSPQRGLSCRMAPC